MNKALLIGIPLALLAAGGGTYWYANTQARDFVDARLANLVASGRYASAEYETLHVGLTGSVDLTNLHLVQGPLNFTLRHLTLSNLDYANEFPRHFDVSISGLHVDAPVVDLADPEGAALVSMLQRFGQGADIPLELSYQHRYDPDNAHQTDSTMQMSVPDSFQLDASGVTRNIELQRFDALSRIDPVRAQQELLSLLQAAEFPSLELSLQDQGLIDAMIATSAQENGVSPEDFRRLLISQAQNIYLFLPGNAQTFAMHAGAELAEFLEGGKTLSLSLAPEYGGNVERLQQEVMGAVFTGDFGRISELLHLELEAE